MTQKVEEILNKRIEDLQKKNEEQQLIIKNMENKYKQLLEIETKNIE